MCCWNSACMAFSHCDLWGPFRACLTDLGATSKTFPEAMWHIAFKVARVVAPSSQLWILKSSSKTIFCARSVAADVTSYLGIIVSRTPYTCSGRFDWLTYDSKSEIDSISYRYTNHDLGNSVWESVKSATMDTTEQVDVLQTCKPSTLGVVGEFSTQKRAQRNFGWKNATVYTHL